VKSNGAVKHFCGLAHDAVHHCFPYITPTDPNVAPPGCTFPFLNGVSMPQDAQPFLLVPDRTNCRLFHVTKNCFDLVLGKLGQASALAAPAPAAQLTERRGIDFGPVLRLGIMTKPKQGSEVEFLGTHGKLSEVLNEPSHPVGRKLFDRGVSRGVDVLDQHGGKVGGGLGVRLVGIVASAAGDLFQLLIQRFLHGRHGSDPPNGAGGH
jgi:hypothetical protein